MEGSGRRPPQGRPSHPQPTCMDVIVSEPLGTPRETAPPARLSPSFFKEARRSVRGRPRPSPRRPPRPIPDQTPRRSPHVLPTR